jgi:aarF domain-containing kinase
LSKIPTGLWSRGSKLVGIASKMAINELSSRVKTWEDEKSKIQARVEMAQGLVKTLSELKGASMKLGQLMSLDLGEYLPPEVIKVLESLHQNSTFLPFEKIEVILKEELKEKFADLKDLSTEPLAAASIGQVHTATLSGKNVVIKVQYPGVAESIPSDLKLLELLVKNLSLLQGKSLDLNPFFKEIEEVLRKETDYELEVRMLQRYRHAFSESNYIVPEVYPEYSTTKVITMERIYGKSFNEWLSGSFIGDRQKMAHQLMNLYLEEFFRYGLVQTDPNPGNFLVTSQNKMALLDFGAVKEYDEGFKQGYRSLLMASFARDEKKILEESISLGFIDERESQEVKDLYIRMMDLLADPFRKNEPFDFNDKTYYANSRDMSWELTRKCKYSPPPKDLLFLHRKLAGVFVLIRKLDVKIVLKDYWHMVEDA